MPYIATKKRSPRVQRRAFATMDAAATFALSDESGAWAMRPADWQAGAVALARGHLVALRDGTVADVEEIGWADFARQADPDEARNVEGNWPPEYLSAHRRTVLAAFNEAAAP